MTVVAMTVAGAGGGKTACTAMGARDGFGSLPETTALHGLGSYCLGSYCLRSYLTIYPKTHYLLLFLLLVRCTYGQNGGGSRVICLPHEHLPRECLTHIRAAKRGDKRRNLGRIYRNVFDLLSFVPGILARGRTSACIEDAPVITTSKPGKEPTP